MRIKKGKSRPDAWINDMNPKDISLQPSERQ